MAAGPEGSGCISPDESLHMLRRPRQPEWHGICVDSGWSRICCWHRWCPPASLDWPVTGGGEIWLRRNWEWRNVAQSKLHHILPRCLRTKARGCRVQNHWNNHYNRKKEFLRTSCLNFEPCFAGEWQRKQIAELSLWFGSWDVHCLESFIPHFPMVFKIWYKTSSHRILPLQIVSIPNPPALSFRGAHMTPPPQPPHKTFFRPPMGAKPGRCGKEFSICASGTVVALLTSAAVVP